MQPKPINAIPRTVDATRFMTEDLMRSGLVPEDVPYGVQPVTSRTEHGVLVGYRIYYDLEKSYDRVRWNRDNPKYTAMRGIPSRTYPPRSVPDYVRGRINATIEGEKKQILWELTTGIPAHGIPGCWSWAENGDEGEDGADTKQIRESIMQGFGHGKVHIVCIDGDWSTNQDVAKAIATYALELEELGVSSHFPDFGAGRGYDDWFVEMWGRDRSKWPSKSEVVRTVLALPQIPVADLDEARRWALSNQDKFNKRHVDFSDRGNATLWLRKIGRANVRYMRDKDEWVFWEHGKWQSKGKFPSEKLNTVARHYFLRAERLMQIALSHPEGSDIRGSLVGQAETTTKWATSRCSSVQGRQAIVTDAASRIDIIATREEFDADPNMLAVLNGIIDLRTGDIREEVQSDMILNRSPVAYSKTEPLSKSSVGVKMVKKFITEITALDHEKPCEIRTKWLQARLGAALRGNNPTDSLEIWQGGGGNGKTVLAKLVQSVLGDYAAWIPAATLMSSRSTRDSEAASPFLMATVRKRIVFSAETKDTEYLDEAKVKLLTGGDPVRMRGLYGAGEEYKSTFTPILLVNPLPQIAAGDEAMWDRIARSVFPFLCRWRRSGATDDVSLPEADLRVKNEMMYDTEARSWMLWWMVQGSVRFEKGGVGEVPDDVTQIGVEYRAKHDHMLSWFEESGYEWGDSGDGGDWVASNVLYASYIVTSESAGKGKIASTIFSQRFLTRFKNRVTLKKKDGVRGFLGVRAAIFPRKEDKTIKTTH